MRVNGLFAGLLLVFCLRVPEAFADKNAFTRLLDNAQFELDSSVSGYFNSVKSNLADNDDAAFYTRLTLKSQTKLTDELHAGFEAYGAYSSLQQEYYGVFRKPGHRGRQPRLLDFNTAWLRYKADDFDITLGKDILKNGLSEIFSPVDVFGLYNLVNPSQIYRIGVWQAGIDYFIHDDTLSFKFLPVAEKILVPPMSSRWLGDTSDPEFTALATNYQIEERFRPVRVENAGYLLQYKGSRAGYDFFGLIHHGQSIYPTLRYGNFKNQAIKSEPLATSISAGVIKVIEEWKFFGEAIYQQTDKNQDEDFIRYSAGGSYNDTKFANWLGLNQITSTLQWLGDETVNAADATTVALASRKARPFRNTVMVKMEIEQNNEWGYFLTGVFNVGGDYGLLAAAQYKPTDNLSLRLESAFFDGNKNTLFGRWQDDDLLRFRAIYKF